MKAGSEAKNQDTTVKDLHGLLTREPVVSYDVNDEDRRSLTRIHWLHDSRFAP